MLISYYQQFTQKISQQMDIYVHKNAKHYVHMLQEDKNYNFVPIIVSTL